MTTPAKVLQVAAAEIGLPPGNDPAQGSKYGRWGAQVTGKAWLAGPSTVVPWCNLFVSWVFAHAGAGAAVGVTGKTVYAWTVGHLQWFKERGALVPISQAQPGDVVFFDWNPGGAAVEHVGIVERNLGGGVLQTIEGNTVSGARGSQFNGGGTWRRVRGAPYIKAVCRPLWNLVKQEEPFDIGETMRIAKVQENGELWLVQDGMEPWRLSPEEWAGYSGLGLPMVNLNKNQIDRIIDSQRKMLKPQAVAYMRIQDNKDILTNSPKNSGEKTWLRQELEGIKTAIARLEGK